MRRRQEQGLDTRNQEARLRVLEVIRDGFEGHEGGFEVWTSTNSESPSPVGGSYVAPESFLYFLIQNLKDPDLTLEAALAAAGESRRTYAVGPGFIAEESPPQLSLPIQLRNS